MIRILVVDDEKPIANYIKLTLKQAGYWVDCAFDGMTALEKAEQVNYDLILLDVMLPEIDGFSLMEYLAPKEVPDGQRRCTGSCKRAPAGCRGLYCETV